MKKQILIINGHQKWEGASEGTLHNFINQNLRKSLSKHELKHSNIISYDINDEIDKFLWADVIIYHFPIFWMSVPWGMKKYLEEILMSSGGKLFEHDGRTRKTPEGIHYGNGGLCKGKEFMFISSMNAPADSFGEDRFFEGDFDKLTHWLRLNHLWIGMETQLPSFVFSDVHKNPDVENQMVELKKLLSEVI